ncbi:hypothetical protein JZ751_018592 [Albula glossodonta]|uniref:BCL2/adenovirus E1B 19 kDa protein-interacting protein 3 n=1 Tax=Albula glossodonta TaxID=121402 RepID=A0A8T2NWM5_9TELE|nr:hypothetical protein JZ751_018592 [Albula glossodonta]
MSLIQPSFSHSSCQSPSTSSCLSTELCSHSCSTMPADPPGFEDVAVKAGITHMVFYRRNTPSPSECLALGAGLLTHSILTASKGSWVEVHFGNGSEDAAQLVGQEQAASVQDGDMERMLLEAQRESGRSSSRGSSHCDSPPRSQTPLYLRSSEMRSTGEKNSSQSEEDFLERRWEIDNIMKKNADWIWDWSSRPENVPPKEFLFKHPKRSGTLSIRNSRVMKKGGIFSAEFLKVFLPSLLISHIMAIGLGIYIGRRLTTSAAL